METCLQHDDLTFRWMTADHPLFLALQEHALGLGFEYCSHTVRLSLPFDCPKLLSRSNYPPPWRARYAELGLHKQDPVLSRSLSNTSPFRWEDLHSTASSTFLDEMRQTGPRHGWTQSSYGPCNALSILSLARSKEPISNQELHEKRHELAWLVQTANLGVMQYMLPPLVALTARERAVLKGTAQGKGSQQIGEELGISERTVHFHANNAAEKLGAETRTAAAVSAALMGLL